MKKDTKSKTGLPNAEKGFIRGDDHWTRKHPEEVRRGHKRDPQTVARGAQLPANKLSDADVADILATPCTHGSGKALAYKYDVSMALISKIRHGLRRVPNAVA